MPVGTFYKTYKGIDLLTKKYVTVYIKPVQWPSLRVPKRSCFPKASRKN
jgi:hypothetical protein